MTKAFLGAGINLPNTKKIIATVRDSDKREFLSIARRFHELGFNLLTTEGTGKALAAIGIPSENVARIGQGTPDIIDIIKSGEIDLVINTPTRGRAHNRDGFLMRRNAVECGIPCLTSLDTASALLLSIERSKRDTLKPVDLALL